MIKELVIKNFKLFREETSIPLSRLNLLTGINGRGKSTVLQVFLLMKQSPDYDRTTNKIIFNGCDVNLGNYKDVKNIQSTENIEFTFKYDDLYIKYNLEPNDVDSTVANIAYIESSDYQNSFKLCMQKKEEHFEVNLKEQNDSFEFKTYLHDLFINEIDLLQNKSTQCLKVRNTLSFNQIHYVSANRIGPQLFYHERNMKDFPTVGSIGEDTVSTLFHYEDSLVGQSFIDYLNRFFHIDLDEIGKTVGLQTEFWLSRLFEGGKYNIKRIEEANLLTFNISPDGTFNYYKPTNVGFGYSYVLPIIVAGLIAQPGDLLIVENPEAHLHPHAQSIIAKFLTLVSLNDVQVIIESHSEHILNGLRIPVYDKIISSNDLNVLYFDRNYEQPYIKIKIEDDGGITNWPLDFFDQSTKDLNYLFGL